METKKTPFEKIKAYFCEHRYFFLTLGLLIILCLLPLSLMATTKGHDSKFHLQRIQALAEEFNNGNFFPRIYSTLLGGNGYASPLFYGDLFLAIPAGLIVWFSFSLTDAYAFFIALCFSATMLSMYFSTYSITKSKKAAFCGSVMFTLSSYSVTVLMQRAAFGEAQAFIFLPIAFAGFYHIFYGEIKKWLLLPLGLAGIIYSHTLSSLMTVAVLFIFFLFSLNKVKERPSRLVYLGISVLLFFALTANFILPMLEQFSSASFLVTDGFSATIYGSLQSHAMPWWSLFYDNATRNRIHEGYIPNGIGLASIAFTAIYIFNRKKHKDSLVSTLLILSGLTLFLTSGLFPWTLFQNVFGILQFPWRLLVYPTFFTALATAIYFGKEQTTKRHSKFMYVVLAFSLCSYIIGALPFFNQYSSYQYNKTEITYDYINRIGSAEYLPSTDEFERVDEFVSQYKDALISNANSVFSDGNPTTDIYRNNGKLVVKFKDMDKDNAYLDVPLLMYKGYTAHLDNGTELECYYGKYNRIRVNVGNVREGTITFEYTGTVVQKVSSVITILAVIGTIAYLIIVCRNAKSASTSHFDRKKKEENINITDENSEDAEV